MTVFSKSLFFGTVLALATSFGASAVADAKYTFYHLLWGMTDANVQFHIKAGDAYMASHPEVEIKYVGPENYDPAEHAKFLDTILNADPDGVALHISSVDALLPGLREAAERGIPVVSVTSHPPTAEDNMKLAGLYLTWVGADESLVGGRMGARLLEDMQPTRVAYLLGHLGHAGQEMRAEGFFSAMPEGVAGDKVAIGEEPQRAKDIIRSYIVANPDVGALFGTATTNKWMTDVLEDLGRDDIAVLTSDASPSSMECVIEGKCLATFSQQFPIQAPFAYEALYQYQENSMWPVTPIATGPMVVDADNVEVFKEVVLNILGEDSYFDMSPY